MAIQPIDLQTLFTQLEKVGKSQAAQRDGTLIQQAIQSVEVQRRTQENIQSVNAPQETGRGAEEIGDRNARRRRGGEDEGSRDQDEADGKTGETEKGESPPGASVFRDPALGKYIDFTG
ncbi:MAG: hypothetical protein LBH51_01890 [Treponema sp.]|jgi:hypothetical protein|nr:hypothetical protein [Treponema sp.]